MRKLTGSFWSRVRGPVLLAIAGCAACCAVPLVGIVIGAGAATAAAAVLEPIAGVLMAAGAVLAIVLIAGRRRAAGGAANACAVDGSCGCGPGERAGSPASGAAPGSRFVLDKAPARSTGAPRAAR